MTNPLVTQIVGARVRAALAAAKALTGVEHPLVKGRLRELVVDQLLRPVLPPSFGLGTGVIVDTRGGTAGEIDIVVYNRDILMPLLYGERDGIFPVEACLYAIEVKSVLERNHIEETISKFRRVSELHRLPPTNSFEPIGVLLAFDDRIDKRERDAILRVSELADALEVPTIRVGCVAGRAYWYFSHTEQCWRVFDADSEHSELVAFMGGLANTITQNDWSPIRKGPLQRNMPFVSIGFGNYLIPEGISRQVPRVVR
jgi:hypothetical protein